MDLAENIAMQDAAGVGIRPVHLDSGRRAAPQTHRWSITGTAGSTRDQADFYNLITATAEAAATLCPTITPAASAFNSAAMARYIADNPAPLRMLHLTGASSDNLFDSGELKFRRQTPDLSEQSETVLLDGFVHDQRQDKKVLSIPINGEVLDGYTSVRLLTAGTVAAATYKASFAFGATNDKRGDVPATRAAVVMPPR